jgi:hypothetical protein
MTIAVVATATAAMPCVAFGASTAEDRLTASVDGSRLTDTNGGKGGALGWLHNFDADSLIGVAAEYQKLSVSNWQFGSLSGALSRGVGDQRYTFYGDAHEGGGRDNRKSFIYAIETVGVSGTYFHRLSATLEDKQVNVETTHGNLPKFQLSYLWNPLIQTALAYQDSIGGNLGTHLVTARIDLYGPRVNFLAGGAIGQASPALLGQELTLPPHDLKEGYVGLSAPIRPWHSDVTLIVDYQHLSSKAGTEIVAGESQVYLVPPSTRWTGTLNWVYHIGHHGT